MRRLLIACAAVSAISALAWAQPAGKPCCELWIFEAANGPDSYALKSRRTGRTYAVVPSASGLQKIEGEAARAVVRRWTAISQLANSTSILLDARESRINLDVDVVDPPDAPGNNDSATLVIIRNATPAQTRKFISEMPRLTDAARAHLATVAAED
jgi:hypothetical protein